MLGDVRVGPVSQLQNVAVTAFNGATLKLVELVPRANDAIAMLGTLTLAAESLSSTIKTVANIVNVTIGPLQQIGGAVSVTTGPAGAVTFLGLSGPKFSAFGIGQGVTVATGGLVNQLAFTNLQAVNGDVLFSGAGRVLAATLAGPASGAGGGLQIVGSLVLLPTGVFRGFSASPLSFVGGSLVLGANLDDVAINSATGPALTIAGDILAGTDTADPKAGACTVNQLAVRA